MPTKRKRIARERQGSDLREWLEMLFGDELFYRYFGVKGDEPFAPICFLIYGPNHGAEIENLRQLWIQNREEILKARDELAPGVEIWAEERFDGKSSELFDDEIEDPSS